MTYKLVLSDPCLFSWSNIPGNDDLKLIEFLNLRFGMEWVKTAKIKKIDGDRTIKIYNGEKFLSLTLCEEKHKVKLEVDKNIAEEFIARTENGQLNIFDKAKDVGENVFFSNLPSNYKVYLLYYPSARSNEDLTDVLRNLGDMTGENLFVNIAKLNDPNYNKIVNIFKISAFPTIIITANNKLASSPMEDSTAYVKIDNKKLLDSPDITIECIEKIFNLFIQGEITKAINKQRGSENIFWIKELINNTLGGLKGFLSQWDISFSFIVGKLEIKPVGGDNA